MKMIEQKSWFTPFLISFFLVVFSTSCILTPDEYDATNDDGTYTGTVTVYDGPGTDPDFKQRTCPIIDATLTVSDGVASLRTVDTYEGGYDHGPGIIKDRTGTASVFANNKFEIEVGWSIQDPGVQMVDLMTLEVCEATPPTTAGDSTTGGKGLLQDVAFLVGEPGFVGEFGQGIARGSLWYGVRCTDGRFIPLCLYFMQLSKQ